MGRDPRPPAGLPIRFAISCPGVRLEDWQARCLEHLRSVGGVELALVVSSRHPPPCPRGGSSRFARRLLAASRAKRPVDASCALSGVPTLGSGSRDQPDAEQLRSADLAFILHLGPGLPPEWPPDVARYGIWHFRPSAYGADGFSLPCFWEMHQGDDVTEATLESLPGTILRQGFFRTDKRSCAKGADELLYECARWPAQVCVDIRNGVAADATSLARPARLPPARTPDARHLLHFATNVVWHCATFAWTRLFRHPQWNIGLVHEPIDTFLDPSAVPEIDWFPAVTKRGFLSDPFGVSVAGQISVIFEYFDYKRARGTISSIDMRDWTSPAEFKPVLDVGSHMSYPYLLEHEDAIYCIPETASNREVALYRAGDFPTQWLKTAVLVDGLAAVDTTLFNHDGRWWLMCTDNDNHPDMNLLIWHARRLEGPWVAHEGNPVKTDVRSSRPAGTPFVHLGELYRPAQDCSKTYGGQIVINRVTRLTPHQFSEEAVATVAPSADSPFSQGRHTLSAVDGVTLIDGHRFMFVGAAAGHFLRIWARSLHARIRGAQTFGHRRADDRGTE